MLSANCVSVLKGAVNIVIGAVLAIYLLLAKSKMKKGFKDLRAALFLDDKLNSVLYFLRRCNFILNRYLVFTLLDAVIVGGITAIIILVLVNPVYALMYVAISLVLQICDGYIIKPKLFGNTLGVSGVLILLAIVVMGNAFGIGGILLAIPVAAICDFTYRDGVLPYLQKRKARRQAEVDAEKEAEEAEPDEERAGS